MRKLIKRMKDLQVLSDAMEQVGARLNRCEHNRIDKLITEVMGIEKGTRKQMSDALDKKAEGKYFCRLENKLNALQVALAAIDNAKDHGEAYEAQRAVESAAREILNHEQ